MKIISPEKMLESLKQVAEIHQNRLKEKVETGLDDREKDILEWVFKQYEDESKNRWYDPFHVLFSTNFALNLVKKEGCDRSIVTAIILHDIGYFAIVDKTQRSKSNSRIMHMQEGAALAAKVLCKNKFHPEEIRKIIGMIVVHDNPYIGIPIKGDDRLALRDCDRIWVMHILSFYRDWASKYKRYKHPKEFLWDRMVQFYGWKHPFESGEWKITIDLLKKNAERIEIPTYGLTKKYVKKQFEHRIQEVKSDYLLGDANRFREYLNTQIDKE